MQNDTITTRLQLDGANCSSCVYTIEHLGRKMDGVKDIYVDRATQQIELSYDGNEETVEKLITIVKKIGYTAARTDT
ncbi:cation transporter [Spirochaeta dissipatitropha]